MSKDNSEPAFPVPGSEYGGTGTCFGMSLRDYFAAKAMQATITAWEHRDPRKLAQQYRMEVADMFACEAYELADAMLAARSQS